MSYALLGKAEKKRISGRFTARLLRETNPARKAMIVEERKRWRKGEVVLAVRKNASSNNDAERGDENNPPGIIEALFKRQPDPVGFRQQCLDTVSRCIKSYAVRMREEYMYREQGIRSYPMGSVRRFAKQVRKQKNYAEVEQKSIVLGPNVYENTRDFLDQAILRGAIPDECLFWRLCDAEEHDTDWAIMTHLWEICTTPHWSYPTLFPPVQRPKDYNSVTTRCIHARFGHLPMKLVYCIVRRRGRRERHKILLPVCFAKEIFGNDRKSYDVLMRATEIVMPSDASLLRSVLHNCDLDQNIATTSVMDEDGRRYDFITSEIERHEELKQLKSLREAQVLDFPQLEFLSIKRQTPIEPDRLPRKTFSGESFFAKVEEGRCTTDGGQMAFRDPYVRDALPMKLVYCVVQEQGLKERFKILLPACFAVDVFAQDCTSSKILKMVTDIIQPSNDFLLKSVVYTPEVLCNPDQITTVITAGIRRDFITSKLAHHPELEEIIAVAKAQKEERRELQMRREEARGTKNNRGNDGDGELSLEPDYSMHPRQFAEEQPRRTFVDPSFFSGFKQDLECREFAALLFNEGKSRPLFQGQTLRDYIYTTPTLKSMYNPKFEKYMDALEREWLCYEKQHDLAKHRLKRPKH